jgi:hypothetical protein
MDNDRKNDILEKLETKMESILSLRIKIALSESFKDFEDSFETDYISIRLEELILDVEDALENAIDDIKSDIEDSIIENSIEDSDELEEIDAWSVS